MAKVKFVGIIDWASGKVCQHSDTSFVHNRYTNACHTMRIHKPEEKPVPSEDQKTTMAAMATRSKVIGYFLNLAKTEAKAGDTAKMDALKRMRNAEGLYSIGVAAGKLYNKDTELIVFEGKNYAPGYVDAEGQGGFGS